MLGSDNQELLEYTVGAGPDELQTTVTRGKNHLQKIGLNLRITDQNFLQILTVQRTEDARDRMFCISPLSSSACSDVHQLGSLGRQIIIGSDRRLGSLLCSRLGMKRST